MHNNEYKHLCFSSLGKDLFFLNDDIYKPLLCMISNVCVQFPLWALFKLAEGVCLLGHIIKRSEMPAGLRGREVDNSSLDVLIRNNGLFRQLCSLILPDWPLVWISLIPTIHNRAALRDPATRTLSCHHRCCPSNCPVWLTRWHLTYIWMSLWSHPAVNYFLLIDLFPFLFNYFLKGNM